MKADRNSTKVSEEKSNPVKYSFLNGFFMYMRCMR